ncbi:hypothetical protein COLO4_21782 [Corchorus olitorius]|uniref:Uncharacterized protein n=1 Tax=Corchorus olitorius TaxID=93759 RepID=A0A1R3IR05_9ROSI|nr:hypothetical protein COLO4_21782 [Corchorus olitorius]
MARQEAGAEVEGDKEKSTPPRGRCRGRGR